MAIVDKTFATLAEANSFLGETLPWEDAEEEDKQLALEWSAVYMMDTYDVVSDDEDACLVTANSLLANYHLTSSVFNASVSLKPEIGLVEQSVKADVVESTKKYDANVLRSWVDPYPEVTALLASKGFTLKKSSGGMSTVAILRR